MDKDLKDALRFTLYYDPEDPQEISLRLNTEFNFTGPDFLDALQFFIQEMRDVQDEMLDETFNPATEAH